jgi:hypothetical protein
MQHRRSGRVLPKDSQFRELASTEYTSVVNPDALVAGAIVKKSAPTKIGHGNPSSNAIQED